MLTVNALHIANFSLSPQCPLGKEEKLHHILRLNTLSTLGT